MARIRPANSADLPAIMRLFRELAEVQEGWRVFPLRADFAQEMDSSYRAALEDPDSLLVVALDDSTAGEEIAGMALGHVHRPSAFSDEIAVELSSVVVRASSRRRGLGRAMAAEIGRFATSRGAKFVTLRTFAQNEGATRFWERAGFQARAIQMVVPADQLGAIHPEE